MPAFVANRLEEILELTTKDEWNYFQISGNPGDSGTRKLPVNALSQSFWLKRPDFLNTNYWFFQPSAYALNRIKKLNLIPTQFYLDPKNNTQQQLSQMSLALLSERYRKLFFFHVLEDEIFLVPIKMKSILEFRHQLFLFTVI